MTLPTKRLNGFRLVAIRRGDTLRDIALRELGDANLWRDLVAINGLVPPYLTDDPTLASDKVLSAGGQLRVPSATTTVSAIDDPDRVFGVDLLLSSGQLAADSGDLVLVGGVANLSQAIKNRIDTPTDELVFHPDYGCQVHELKGEKNTPMAATLGGAYVKGALTNDPRIDSVPSVSVSIAADAMLITATARAVSGSTIDIQTTG